MPKSSINMGRARPIATFSNAAIAPGTATAKKMKPDIAPVALTIHLIE
ncbi:hypothetical protein GCM10007879_25390 [Maritalea porphyrae]|uniref:Uncharacterized protein n=1 Tax=Maritalea porphyrae TaxID=880732 RepID=A0ABQ5UVA2_9HYPH|nr:hypothetical protein GCM10007879_25390 [Maritalea porphyrae]